MPADCEISVGKNFPHSYPANLITLIATLGHSIWPPFLVGKGICFALGQLDGFLHHETDLTIKGHYTDTAGYIDQIFGSTHLLGFRFTPRLRDLADPKLCATGKPLISLNWRSGCLGNSTQRLFKRATGDVLRLVHSIWGGTVSASTIMGKFGSSLDYLSSEALRRRIHSLTR